MKKQNQGIESISPDLVPEFIPIKCPICKGFGSFSYGKIVCNSCGGLGYLKVPPKDEAQND